METYDPNCPNDLDEILGDRNKNVDKTNEISNNKKKSGEDIAWNILMKMGWKKGKGIFLII